eukprot:m.412847 g.412847  ORF g.412847 m.412847 type:complete len:454 (+) comp56570_c0_seq3:85-1446(+)
MLFQALCVLVVAGAAVADNSDLITSLPGMPTLPSFPMYSGYVTVNATAGRSLFYFFAESQNDPATDPIVWWLQGGPGCSSLVGLFTENGPLRVVAAEGNSTGLNVSVVENGWSWNRFANVLYVDSPAGVGFSYSNTPSDYNTNNNRTAEDNYAFLQGWLQKFPQFANNPVFLTGESYGGDYVPQLAYQIITGESQAIKQNLKGFTVGNPVFSCQSWRQYGNTIQVELYYWHALIPYSMYSEWFKIGCNQPIFPARCQALMNQMNTVIGPNFDPDNLYTDLTAGNASLGVGPNVAPGFSVWDLRNYWLNLDEVQEALHVYNPVRPWAACCAEPGQTGAACNLNYTNNWTDMLPTYNFFFEEAPQLDILIYSGDTDIATCPHAYAQLCLAELDRTLVKQWAAWELPGFPNQTAGFVEVYDKYTYATVKGAGHEVPQFQPAAAYHMISSFLQNSFP